MMVTKTAGVVINTARKNGSVRDIRRMAGLERAATMMGGQAALADALGIDARLLRRKIAAERPIRDEELALVAGSLSKRAREIEDLASKLRTMSAEAELDARLARRRATQAKREDGYRARQARAIHAAASADILMAEAAARA